MLTRVWFSLKPLSENLTPGSEKLSLPNFQQTEYLLFSHRDE